MGDRRRWLAWLAVPGGTAGVLVASSFVAPVVPVPPAVGFVVAFALVAGAMIASGWLVPLASPRALVWVVVPGVAVGLLAWTGHASAGWPAAAVVAASLLVGGALAGTVVGSRIQHAGHLLVVAWVSTLADAYSVLSASGVSARVVESAEWLPLLAVSWPIYGTDAIEPVLGVGDVVMVALYLTAVRRHGLRERRTVVALAVAFAAVLVALFASGIALPALPFLGVAVVAVHPEARRLRPEDRKPALLGVAVLTVLFAILWAT